jgi:hypothetical protein
MNDDLNEFERVARARLHRELGRVPVPAGRSSRARPRSTPGWGPRIVGGSAVVAMLILAAMILAGGLPVAPETAQVATQTAQTAGAAPAERMILLSTGRSTTIIRAVDPATRQVLWTVENPAQPATGPAWIDGAIAPDGSRLFVATRDGLAAYDAATGQRLWTKDAASAEQSVRQVPGRPSALAVAADGQRLYIQKQRPQSQGRSMRRWLDTLDADTGKTRAGIELPPSDDVAQVFALADEIYYVTSSQVFMIRTRNQSFDRSRTVDIPPGVSAAGPARDGRSIYVSNGKILLNIDSDGLTTPLPPEYQPVYGSSSHAFPSLRLTEAISGTDMIIDYDAIDADAMKIQIDPEDPFWWKNNPLAISPDGTIAAVQEFTSVAARSEPPRLMLYDLASWKPIATIADPGTSKADWLRGDTLHFNAAGTAIYAIAGPRGSGGGDSALLSLSVAGGSPTRLIELPGETVAALLMASPPGAPGPSGPPAEPPTDESIPARPAPPPPDFEPVWPDIELPPTK